MADRLLLRTPTSSRGPTEVVVSDMNKAFIFLTMAVDLDAREVTINYAGGSLTMTVGNAKHLFGEGSPFIGAGGIPKTTSVKSHPRTRVIGGATKTVGAYSYTYESWPTSGHGQAAGGEPVMMTWENSQGSWQARVTGPLYSLANFLEQESPKFVWFQALGGRNYGPFKFD